MPIVYTCLFYWRFSALSLSLNSPQWQPLDLEQMGSRDSAILTTFASQQCGPGWIPARYNMQVAPGVFLRVLRFPSSTKTNNFIFQFDQDRGPTLTPAKTNVVSCLNI